MNIILYTEDPLLLDLAVRCRKKALLERRVQTAKIQKMESIWQSIALRHEDLVDKIVNTKRLIRLQTHGVRTTESLDTISAFDNHTFSTSYESDEAHKFLCKRAYRMAASMTHPDRWSFLDDFVFINQAYRAGDLATLQEYVVSNSGTVCDRISYWKAELVKPSVAWARYQASQEFRVVKLQMSGKQDEATQVARSLLNQVLRLLEMQLLHYQEPAYSASTI